MQTTWNLKLLYESPEDPQIEKDIKQIVAGCKKFEKTWKGNSDFVKKEKVLVQAFKDYETAYALIQWQKPLWYFQLLQDIHSDHPTAGARVNQISQVITDAENHLVFFEIALSKVSKEVQKKFLKSPLLKPYRYHLMKVFNQAKHYLSEAEEKILSSTELTSYDMWVKGVQGVMGAEKIEWKGSIIGMSEASEMLPSLVRTEREQLYEKIMIATKHIAPFAEAEMNAVLTLAKIKDELRGYKHPFSFTVSENENNDRSVISLAKIVSDHFTVSKKFFAIKKKMLGITDTMRSFDMGAQVGVMKKSFAFADSVKIVTDAFNAVDPEFGGLFTRFLEEGRFDVFPRMHKRGGGYCWGHGNLPTFILLNDVGDFASLQTIAHEMGHAIHGEFSKKQPVLYEQHTTSTAEVASTFFEQVSFEAVFETLSDDDKIIALHEKLMGSIGTVFVQIAFFNFECELHETLRKDGFVSKEKMSALMVKHRTSYLGDAVTLYPDDGLFWVRLSHIRNYFYVYTYAYGGMISAAMYGSYKEDRSFVTKLKKFLSAGGSDTPENIFKSIGIDTTKDEFWIAGIKKIEQDVIKLEKLVNKKAR